MSPLAWRTVWLNKLEKKCSEQGLDNAMTSKYSACLNGLLALYPGHPRDIPLDQIQKYLNAAEAFDISRAALIFFFTTVAYAPAIFQALELATAASVKPISPKKTTKTSAKPRITKVAAVKKKSRTIKSR